MKPIARLGLAVPAWINEGIASLFEHFYFSAPGEIHGAKNWRHPRLIQAAAPLLPCYTFFHDGAK